MVEARLAILNDLTTVTSWLRSQDDCRMWAGTRVSFPVDLPGLPSAIQFHVGESWALVEGGELVAFGQIFPVADHLHFSRLIAKPERRGTGIGRLLTQHLLKVALARKPRVVSLNVMPDNIPARGLYQSLGFREARRPLTEPTSHPSIVYMEHAAQQSAAADTS